MNNVATVTWRISSLGLRATANFEPLLSISCIRLRASVDSSSRPSYTTRPSHLAASLGTKWLHRTGAGSGMGACASGRIQELRSCSIPASLIRRGSELHTGSSLYARTQSTPPKSSRRVLKADYVKGSNAKPNLKTAINLSNSDIAKILGPSLRPGVGNTLLSTLQKRRVTGRLDEVVIGPGVDEVTIAKALAWLRKNHPYDEDAAIMQRIEQEEQDSKDKFVADGERLGLYTPQHNSETSKHGKSGLDAIREHYESQRVKEQAEEVRNSSPDSAMIQHPKERAVLEWRSESAEWVKRYKEKALLDNLDFSEASWSGRLQRLFPSTVFVATVICFCVLLAQNYVPPSRQARIWPDMPPAAATVISLIVMNSAAFILWRVPPMWRFMNKFFLIVPAYPRVWSLIGNVFSHQQPVHFLGNMAALWFIGTRLHDEIGRGNFLAIYLASGVFASYFSLSRFLLTNNLITTSLGASGALCGVIAAWCTIHARAQFQIRFLPPEWGPIFSLNLLLAVLFAGGIIGILRGYRRTDHWAHIGGYASGFLGAQGLKYRARKMSEQRELMQSHNGTALE